MKLLNYLEEEAIYIIREVAAQFQRPSLLFSGGKDSIVLSYLAKKAFLPGSAPFDLVHIDTGHNFQEALDFRDRWVAKHQFKLKVYYVQMISTMVVFEKKKALVLAEINFKLLLCSGR